MIMERSEISNRVTTKDNCFWINSWIDFIYFNKHVDCDGRKSDSRSRGRFLPCNYISNYSIPFIFDLYIIIAGLLLHFAAGSLVGVIMAIPFAKRIYA
jgi:hypothetical protein